MLIMRIVYTSYKKLLKSDERQQCRYKTQNQNVKIRTRYKLKLSSAKNLKNQYKL